MPTGIKDVDIVYMTRMQEERFKSPDEFAKYRGSYVLDRASYEKHCQPDTAIMHPLPRDSRPGASELSNDLNNHPNLSIFQQTDNGIPIRMALYALVMDVADKVHECSFPKQWYTPKPPSV